MSLGIAAIILLIRQPDQELQALGLSSLRHLSVEKTLKRMIVEERALRPAVKAIGSNYEDIQLQCAGVLANLSELPENQTTMVEESAVVGLTALAFSRYVYVCKHVCTCKYAYILYVCIYLCVCISICMYMYVYICI